MDASSIPSYVDGQPLIGSGEAFDNINPVSYTHLTLPTNREV